MRDEHGIVPGKYLAVKEVRGVDGVVTVEDEEGGLHPLGRPVAAAIFVRDPSDDQEMDENTGGVEMTEDRRAARRRSPRRGPGR